MTGLHVLVVPMEGMPISITQCPDKSGSTQSWFLKVDPLLAKVAKWSLAGIAVAWIASTSPITFTAMLIAGAALGTKLDWLNNAVDSAWNTITHEHDGHPCYSSKFFLGLGAAATVLFAPTVAAAYTGQRLGHLLSPHTESFLHWLGVNA